VNNFPFWWQLFRVSVLVGSMRSRGGSTGAGAHPGGDVRAFPAEFERIRRALQRQGVNANDSEDLAQDVFLVMCRRWRDYDARRPLDRWLTGIAFKIAQRYRRRSGREVLTDVAALARAAAQSGGEDQLARERLRRQVMNALESLPERHRAIIVMRVIDEVPMQQVAKKMSVPLFTAYNRLRTARLALAKAVGRLGLQRGIAPLDGAVGLEALLRGSRAESAPPPGTVGRSGSSSAIGALSPARRVLTALTAAGALAVIVGLSVQGGSARPSPAPGETAGAPMASASAGLRAGRARAQVLALSAPVAPSPLRAGLIGYWRFDEGQGSAVVRDHSDQRNDCQLRQLDPSTSWTAGALGGALAFDGRGWLECPAIEGLARLEGELSISVWIRRDGPPGRGIHTLVSRQLGSRNQDHFFLGLDGVFLEFSSHLFRGFLARPLPAASGRWIHLAVVRAQDATMKMFVNGVEVGKRRSAGHSYGGGSTPLTIGGGVNGPLGAANEAFEGSLDELLMYDRALSDEEIEALAGGVQPRAW
jgi:RNA polymerase sigma factor (sigma-70 family)